MEDYESEIVDNLIYFFYCFQSYDKETWFGIKRKNLEKNVHLLKVKFEKWKNSFCRVYSIIAPSNAINGIEVFTKLRKNIYIIYLYNGIVFSETKIDF